MNAKCSIICVCLEIVKIYLGHSGVNAMKGTSWTTLEVRKKKYL